MIYFYYTAFPSGGNIYGRIFLKKTEVYCHLEVVRKLPPDLLGIWLLEKFGSQIL